jgi:hypothetical protein
MSRFFPRIFGDFSEKILAMEMLQIEDDIIYLEEARRSSLSTAQSELNTAMRECKVSHVYNEPYLTIYNEMILFDKKLFDFVLKSCGGLLYTHFSVAAVPQLVFYVYITILHNFLAARPQKNTSLRHCRKIKTEKR